MYIAGVGHDPRPFRKFNTKGQAERYDADKTYRNLWLK
jgi:deoxyribodipyrimidine photo-lyase